MPALKLFKATDPQHCMGRCDKHGGPIPHVNVFDAQYHYDWGDFYYCDAACGTDRDAGFTVLPVKRPSTPEGSR